MIKVLKEEADRNNLDNVETICTDFASFNVPNYEKSFDISFASMTPAIIKKKTMF